MTNDSTILDFERPEGFVDPTRFTASGGQRFLNYIIDRIAIYLIFFLLSSVQIRLSSNEDLLFIAFLFLVPVYYVLPEYFLGKTLAKFLTKTSVVNLQGERPSLLKIIGRSLCRLIPFEQFSFLGSRAVGWHDTISSTRVVEDRYFQDDLV